MTNIASLIDVLSALLLSPMLVGVIRKTKALIAGRRGPPLLQAYYDLIKLLRKGAVYSPTTTWLFRAGPIVSLAAMIIAASFTPFAGARSLLAFEGDIIFFAYLFGLARFFTVLAALDTGSSFEGMGASRELQIGLLAEPTLFLSLAVLVRETSSLSLSVAYHQIDSFVWPMAMPELLLVMSALFIVFLAENSRIPIDDPTTHLELTMVHEVMVLDHSGPDLAFVQYAASLKLWLLGSLVFGLLLPFRGYHLLSWLEGLMGMLLLGIAVGLVESLMARLRMNRVPRLLLGATVAASLAMVLALR